jgi:hypothetical protein
MALHLDDFKSSLIYQQQCTAAEIAADIEHLRRLDQETEGELTMWLYVLIASILVIVGCAAAAIMIGGVAVFAAMPVGVLALIGLIIAAVQRWRLGEFDLENRRYELVHGMLNMLGRDMDKSQKINIRLDLRTPQHDHKLRGEGVRGRWNVKFYHDPWLEMRGKLLDGTVFDIYVVEKYQARGKWGGRRGNKWKTKDRTATEVIVELTPKAEKYPKIDNMAEQLYGAVRLPQWVTIKLLHMHQGTLLLRVVTPAAWDCPPPPEPGKHPTPTSYNGVDLVSLMFLSLYQPLNLTRAVDKAQRGGPQG